MPKHLHLKYSHLNSVEHRDVRVTEKPMFSVFSSIDNCAIVFDELFSAAGCFPVFLMKDPANGAFYLSVIFGLKNNGNLFAGPSSWEAPYSPLNLRRMPFAFDRQVSNNAVGAYDIYIDKENAMLSSAEGYRLFDQSGKETAFLKDKKRILGALIQGQDETNRFIAALLQFDLVSQININLTLLNGSETVSGLYALDHLKMKSITEETYLQLGKENLLEAIFLMKASYSQISRLVWLENQSSKNTILNYSISPISSDII